MMEEKITAWISVKDKLPSERSECIPCRSKQVLCRLSCGLLEICQYDFANKCWLKYDNLITHWMSIPELKEEQPIEEKITAWIARDKHNVLTLFEEKPNKIVELGWWDISKHEMVIPKELFPQVKWGDEEPTKVELTIKIK